MAHPAANGSWGAAIASAALLALWLGVSHARAQSAPTATSSAQAPTFDAISIRPNRGGDAAGGADILPGRLVARNVTVAMLIRDAYELRGVQVTGGPSWATGGWNEASHFDIQATMAPDTPAKDVYAMMRSLLRDRFMLAAHRESREVPAYALVREARSSNDTPARARADNCFALPDANAPVPQPAPAPRAAPPTSGRNEDRLPCGMVAFGPGMVRGRSVAMTQLANALSNRRATGDVDRVVVDRTGLSGVFDIELHWTPLQAADTAGVTLFAAIQEQLGLRLEPTTAKVDLLVVDHVERPTQN